MAGPPPPPPPVFVEKTRGSKNRSGPLLQLACWELPQTAGKGTQHGACVWLRATTGSWHSAVVSADQFSRAYSGGVLMLLVDFPLLLAEACIEPNGTGWAQGVNFTSHSVAFAPSS